MAWVTIHAMWMEMLSLVLQLVTGLVGGACLMRLYMQWHRIPLAARAGNPLGPFIFALTNWLVLPLRRVMPSIGRLDTASLVAAYLVVLAKIGLMVWLGMGGGLWWMVLWGGLFGFVGAVPVRSVWAGLGACGAVVGAHRFGHGRLGGPHGAALVVAAAAHPAHLGRD